MYVVDINDMDIPEFVVGEIYELWPEIQLIVLTDDHMIIVAPFGTVDVTKSEISGLWLT